MLLKTTNRNSKTFDLSGPSRRGSVIKITVLKLDSGRVWFCICQVSIVTGLQGSIKRGNRNCGPVFYPPTLIACLSLIVDATSQTLKRYLC